MRYLFNALIKPKIKTVYILILTAVIVMMSIHTNGSLNGSELQIIQRLDSSGLSHANINSTSQWIDAEDYDKLFDLLDSYKTKGVRYETEVYDFSDSYQVWVFPLYPENLSVRHNSQSDGLIFTDLEQGSNEQYVVELGKNFDELADGEIILPMSLLEAELYDIGDTYTFKTTVILDSFYFKGENEKFTTTYCSYFDEPECMGYERFEEEINYDVTVVGFARQRFHNEYITESDFNTNIEFFKPDRPMNQNTALVTSKTMDAIFDSRKVDLSSVQEFGQKLIEARPYYTESLQTQLEEFFSSSSEDLGMITPKGENFRINVYYDNFSKDMEDQLAKDINNLNLGQNVVGEAKRFRLDTLSSKMDKEPMVTSVLQVLSKYVLMGVLISSFYSFYIHFRNQIRTSSKEISALLMQGVSWSRVFGVYLLELALIGLCALVVYLIVAMVAGQLNLLETLYSAKMSLHMKTLGYSIIYFVGLSLVLLLSLMPFRKDVLQKFKKGAQTQLSGFGLTKSGLIRQLSIKRVTKYIASSVGFAFSIALVVAVIVLSVSSSYHLKNLYSEETFGITFDYMVTFNDFENSSEIYEATKQYTEVQAQIGKNEEVLFAEHDLWEGNSKFYKSSEIVFYNEIKDFVPLYSGTYPPHWTEIKGDPPRYRQTALASRRHLDRRNISRKKNSVESNYLFYFDNETTLYEQAYEIFGKTNALYNNGWALSAYLPFYEGPFEPTPLVAQQYVMNLKEDVSSDDFESFLDTLDVSYLKYDTLLNEFQMMNDQMNETSLLISLTVTILMTLLLMINIGGLAVSVKLEIVDDDAMFKKMGISSGLIKRVNISVLILRVLASIAFLGVLVSVIYPLYFNDLLGAFGLFSMPGSIIKPFIITSFVIVVLLLVLFGLTSRRKN